MTEGSDPLWYKDAIIYQLHVKAFFDSDNDGMGDFAGLTAKLDYLQELGVTALWLLPFYPSPQRDDGYDIAAYKQVNPSYGTMADFRALVRAAHARGMKIIIELVINHTSDQHPWFQRARRARPGSAWRDFYVWSDTDQKYSGTRIIFTDTETSNWAWDPVAKAYYWHRFFSHQPDLNFDNPRVLKEVISVMQFWLDAGVDGLRLDAVPYLCEREGTNNENLPETHDVLKRIRAALDERYSNRMLLAEANQWPEDVRAYFGDGDECHMAFHFPLMPRIYMAVAQEDRHPIVDIMRQTPEIPENCQWATFLRNHDELTLEMVTDRERDYLWNFYAADPRARVNVGIRRRLAPLMDNDRRKIELLNSLLFSMPGTPVLYYGDEIGMGDNIFLGDRNGVRTPMQWSPDRNGGFSRADPASLYLPPLMDPVYGYEALNVEAQRRSPSSLLNWMRQILTVTKSHQAFGRGRQRFLQPSNRKVLAHFREYEGETVLCVANLSRSAQAVELDLQEFNGRLPLELLGNSPFPRIGELPYLLTLPAYAFYWFLLQEGGAGETESYADSMPDLLTLVTPRGWQSVTGDGAREMLERQILPDFLPAQRWCAAKGAGIAEARLAQHAILPGEDTEGWLMPLVAVTLASGEAQTYSMPLAVAWESGGEDPLTRLAPFSLARVRRGGRVGVAYDAFADERFPRALLRAMIDERELPAGGGRIAFFHTNALEMPEEGIEGITTRRLGADQSNTSVALGAGMILKGYRRLQQGIHPEVEVSRFLTEVAKFPNTPTLYGGFEYVAEDGERVALGILQALIPNQGDGWTVTSDYLDRYLDDMRLLPPEEPVAPDAEAAPLAYYLELARRLGQRTGEMHQALAIASGNPDFDPEPITGEDLRRWTAQAGEQLQRAAAALRRAELSPDLAASAEVLFAAVENIDAVLATLLPPAVEAVKTRHHGDFHLGQVLVAKNDFYIVDFEGEPARPIEERRAKTSALRDVAGMLRSFNYAGWAALFRLPQQSDDDRERLLPHTTRLEAESVSGFLRGYREAMQGCPVLPQSEAEAQALLDLFLLEKAAYEVAYEAANRPDWIHIPLRGVVSLLQARRGEDA